MARRPIGYGMMLPLGVSTDQIMRTVAPEHRSTLESRKSSGQEPITPCPTGTGRIFGLCQAVNCLATITPSLRDIPLLLALPFIPLRDALVDR